MKIALVLPHIFMSEELFANAIFAPGHLVIDLAIELTKLGIDVTFFSPGYRIIGLKNVNADLSLFEEELKERSDTYMDLLKKHPAVFSTLARQVQTELISQAYSMANEGKFDLVHIYGNEEELALIMAQFCQKPVVFTHHEPFNFLVKYRSIFPKYKYLNWISISHSQRKSNPDGNFIANIYHGIPESRFNFHESHKDYFAYFGRIVENKGVHLAIAAAKKAGVRLKIAGKHYSGFGKEEYWSNRIEPELDDKVEYVGFLKTDKEKEEFLGNAKALLVPSIWDEPFGMVNIEALACGTPVIATDIGAIPEIIKNGKSGFLVTVKKLQSETKDVFDEKQIIHELAEAIKNIHQINRHECRTEFEKNFTSSRMAEEHFATYAKLLKAC